MAQRTRSDAESSYPCDEIVPNAVDYWEWGLLNVVSGVS